MLVRVKPLIIWNLLLPLLFSTLASSRNILRAAPEDQITLGSGEAGGTPRALRFAVFGDSWASGINFGPPSAESVNDTACFINLLPQYLLTLGKR